MPGTSATETPSATPTSLGSLSATAQVPPLGTATLSATPTGFVSPTDGARPVGMETPAASPGPDSGAPASPSPSPQPTPLAPRPSPTREQHLGLCPAPFPAVFTPVLTPVLVPAADFEQNCVLEPNVIMGPDKLYHMTYSCNAFSKGGLLETVALATSPDLIHWTRYGDNPIVGNGHGGEDQGASMSFQMHIGSEWRIYVKGVSNAAVDYVTSTDGYHYKFGGNAILPSQFKALCGQGQDLDSCGIIREGKDYWAIAEVMSDTCTVVPGPLAYVLWLFKSTDGAKSFSLASKTPLSTITSSARLKCLYAGGRATFRAGGAYYTFPHINLPSSIYLSKSYDLKHWKTYKLPVVGPSTDGSLFGLARCNQAADASVIEANGKTYLFYDGTDNFDAAGRIGMAVYPGTEADLAACRFQE